MTPNFAAASTPRCSYDAAAVSDGVAVFDALHRRHKVTDAMLCALEGIVSKQLSAPYRSGPCRDWIKVKNPDSPAMIRHREGQW